VQLYLLLLLPLDKPGLASTQSTPLMLLLLVLYVHTGKPCIEVVNHPGPLLHMPLNKPGLPVPNGEYMGSLWTVCDCTAQPSPVLPALPCFDLKKHLLGKMHPLFAALVAGGCEDVVWWCFLIGLGFAVRVLPCFDLKKHLLGKMRPLFAALVAGEFADVFVVMLFGLSRVLLFVRCPALT
jgi:hypothetical protein